jgi:hypothetical protein
VTTGAETTEAPATTGASAETTTATTAAEMIEGATKDSPRTDAAMIEGAMTVETTGGATTDTQIAATASASLVKMMIASHANHATRNPLLRLSRPLASA